MAAAVEVDTTGESASDPASAIPTLNEVASAASKGTRAAADVDVDTATDPGSSGKDTPTLLEDASAASSATRLAPVVEVDTTSAAGSVANVEPTL